MNLMKWNVLFHVTLLSCIWHIQCNGATVTCLFKSEGKSIIAMHTQTNTRPLCHFIINMTIQSYQND